VAQVFRFLDILGFEMHTISDPNDQLPIPQIMQVITIDSDRMRVESVTLERTDPGTPFVYDVRARTILSKH